ncbi:class I SAM-dependent methyltransferase [Nocardia camponoti]|nr:methyltransferase domain-containing protein [Nocardia camponoti]
MTESADRRLSARALSEGDPTGWFEPLYAEAALSSDPLSAVPWHRDIPNPLLVEWVETHPPTPGTRAIVVGSGYGTDAEYIAAQGIPTVAFDISPSAITATRERFPSSRVEYRAADLLALPPDWAGAFDLVIESLTIQSLPPEIRAEAIAGVRSLVAPGGTLLVIANVAQGVPPSPPWPLSRADIDAIASPELELIAVEAFAQPGHFLGARWVAEYRRVS